MTDHETRAVLAKMGVDDADMPTAVEATRRLVRRYGPDREEEAAEFIGTAMAICNVHGAWILLLPNLVHSAERLSAPRRTPPPPRHELLPDPAIDDQATIWTIRICAGVLVLLVLAMVVGAVING